MSIWSSIDCGGATVQATDLDVYQEEPTWNHYVDVATAWDLVRLSISPEPGDSLEYPVGEDATVYLNRDSLRLLHDRIGKALAYLDGEAKEQQ